MSPPEIANLSIALVALLVAMASLAYAWRTFALQRHSTSIAGLEFLHVERSEEITDETTNGLSVRKVRSYFVSTILSIGPGLRYGATGAVWGEGEFEVLTPQVRVWGPEHPGIEFELKRTREGSWEDVYCGVVWETPRMFKKGFTTHGYRLKVPAPGSREHEFLAEEWMPRSGKWRALKKGRQPSPGPLAEASHTGASFSTQLGRRYPDVDWLAGFLGPMRRKGKDQE